MKIGKIYSQRRIDELFKRSYSQGYQNAYENIAERLELPEDAILIDACCGTGELLRRVYQRLQEKPNSLRMFGIDKTYEMLEYALKNLQNYGIETRICEFYESLPHYEKIRLIHDDLGNSIIPKDFSDFTICSFPEFLPEVTPKVNGLAKIISNKLAMLRSNEDDKPSIASAFFVHSLSRVTKSGGRVILVDYGVGEGHSNLDKRMKRRVEYAGHIAGLSLTKMDFFENEEVWNDVTERVRREASSNKRGYWIINYKKN